MENNICEPVVPYETELKYWNKNIFDPIQIILSGTAMEFQIRKVTEINVAQFGLGAIKPHHTLKFTWEGGLKDLKNDFDGVSLQHFINTLRK